MMNDLERARELKEKERILRDASASIKVQEKDLPRVVERFMSEIKEMDAKLSTYSNE